MYSTAVFLSAIILFGCRKAKEEFNSSPYDEGMFMQTPWRMTGNDPAMKEKNCSYTSDRLLLQKENRLSCCEKKLLASFKWNRVENDKSTGQEYLPPVIIVYHKKKPVNIVRL